MIAQFPRSLLLIILITFLGCCPHRFKPSDCPDPLPPFCIPEKIKVALVLGSGGVRGIAHVGVLEELVAANIPIDIIIGCSAGSIVGALYADSLDTEMVKSAVWNMRVNSILDIDIWNCCYGLSQGGSLYRILDKYLCAETFEELKIPFVTVASDLNTGELVPIGTGDLVSAIRASCSIPVVFVPCNYGGRVLVDGGVVNPTPAKLARDMGAQIVIVVDLCELLPRTFPRNLFEVGTRSAEIAFMWQNESCTREADIVIRPKTCGVGAFNDKMKGLIYESGKRSAREQIPEIIDLLHCSSTEPCQGMKVFYPQCYTPQIYHSD